MMVSGLGLSRRCVLSLLAAVLVLGSAGCKATPTEKVIAVAPPPQRVDPEPTATERAVAPQTTADEIYTVYSQNLIEGANADQRYLNRLLWVAGVVNGVNRSLPGRPYLELRTHDDGAFTYAAMSVEAAPLLSALVLGTRVDLLCRGDGALGGDPFLRDCRGR
jgi:hypothetical protein